MFKRWRTLWQWLSVCLLFSTRYIAQSHLHMLLSWGLFNQGPGSELWEILSPSPPLGGNLQRHRHTFGRALGCVWGSSQPGMLELACQAPQGQLWGLTLTWNSKFVFSRNFWFMVSANLLIALRKTLEEGRRSPGHLSTLTQTSLPRVPDNRSLRERPKDPRERPADPHKHLLTPQTWGHVCPALSIWLHLENLSLVEALTSLWQKMHVIQKDRKTNCLLPNQINKQTTHHLSSGENCHWHFDEHNFKPLPIF